MARDKFRGDGEDYDWRRLVDTAKRLAEALRYEEEPVPGMDFEACATGLLQIRTADEDGSGTAAEIKLFPVSGREEWSTFSYENGKIEFIRLCTDTSGLAADDVPVGNYLVQVSKGSEYKRQFTYAEINEERKTELSFKLTRGINIKQEKWYAGDLHHHSIYSSPVYGGTDAVTDTPEEVAASMQAAGLSFGALSDHHNVLNHRAWEAVKSEKFHPIISKEISTSNGHVLALGVEEDVIYRIPEETERTDEYLRAEFVRITGQIRQAGGLPQLNHPRDMQKAISFNPAYTDMIDVFETLEIWNGSHPLTPDTTNYQAFALWLSLLEEGRYLPATTGSDTHDIALTERQKPVMKVLSLYGAVKEKAGELTGEAGRDAAYFLKIMDAMHGKLERFLKCNMSSGCVRTYVQADGELTTQAIFNALRKGNSFLTNGPILLAKVNGAGPGETAERGAGELHAELRIYANRPLKTVTIYQNGGKTQEISLEEGEEAVFREKDGVLTEGSSDWYDYSRTLLLPSDGVKWLFFVTEGDFSNKAMTNPIFIK